MEKEEGEEWGRGGRDGGRVRTEWREVRVG